MRCVPSSVTSSESIVGSATRYPAIAFQDLRRSALSPLWVGEWSARLPLPLPSEVGEALATYLCDGRPRCSTRCVFVRGRHAVLGAEQARQRAALIIARVKAGEVPAPCRSPRNSPATRRLPTWRGAISKTMSRIAANPGPRGPPAAWSTAISCRRSARRAPTAMASPVVAAGVRHGDGPPQAGDDAVGQTWPSKDTVLLPRQPPSAADVALPGRCDPSP